MDQIFKMFKKEFSNSTLWRGDAQNAPIQSTELITTNNFVLDYVIGRPGIPLGRILEIFGPFSTGKSSMCASILGSITRAGNIGVLVDTEHSWSSEWMDMYGIKKDNLYILQPPSFQDMFEEVAFICASAHEVMKDEQSMVIVIDSLSAIPTREEVAGEKEGLALHAKLLSKGLRVLTNLIWEKRVSIMCVSQLKDNPMKPFAAMKLGGSAVDFHAAVQLKVQRIAKQEDRIRLKLTGVKNKVAFPFKSVIFDLIFAKGIDDTLPILQAAVEYKIIEGASGGWYPYEGKKYRADELVPIIRDKVYEAVFQRPDAELSTPTTVEVAADTDE